MSKPFEMLYPHFLFARNAVRIYPFLDNMEDDLFYEHIIPVFHEIWPKYDDPNQPIYECVEKCIQSDDFGLALCGMFRAVRSDVLIDLGSPGSSFRTFMAKYDNMFHSLHPHIAVGTGLKSPRECVLFLAMLASSPLRYHLDDDPHQCGSPISDYADALQYHVDVCREVLGAHVMWSLYGTFTDVHELISLQDQSRAANALMSSAVIDLFHDGLSLESIPETVINIDRPSFLHHFNRINNPSQTTKP